jgi:hypothetical protein
VAHFVASIDSFGPQNNRNVLDGSPRNGRRDSVGCSKPAQRRNGRSKSKEPLRLSLKSGWRSSLQPRRRITSGRRLPNSSLRVPSEFQIDLSSFSLVKTRPLSRYLLYQPCPSMCWQWMLEARAFAYATSTFGLFCNVRSFEDYECAWTPSWSSSN